MEKSIATKILDRKVKKEVVEQKKVLDQKRVREEDNRLREKEEDRKLVNQMREWEVKKQQQDNENKMRQMKELKEVLTVQIQQRGQSPQKPTSYLGSNDGGASHSPKKPVYRPVPAKPAPPAIQKKSPVPKKAGKTSAGGNK